jgi:ankyrin repeat protein
MASMAKAQDYVSGGAAADARDMASPGANEPSNLVVTAERRAAQKPGRGARLRAAAADGRLAEVEALLDHGESVDAPDADGDTALMRSILADRPAVAAVLRRHGASLDRKNHAGESARDMAMASEDTALKRALGLSP